MVVIVSCIFKLTKDSCCWRACLEQAAVSALIKTISAFQSDKLPFHLH